jgi:hypothetical protein
MISKFVGILFAFILAVGTASARADVIDIENISFTTTSSADNRPDILPPSGSIHAYYRMTRPPENRLGTVTLAGHLTDESGISSAYIRVVAGNDEITVIDLGEFRNFNIDIEVAASKGAEYLIELFASDSNPEKAGGANSGLVDSTFIRIPHDVSVWKPQ